MRRLLLWFLILTGMSSSVPAVRTRVEPHVTPIREYLVQKLGPTFERGFAPFYRWLAEHEMRMIALELRRRSLALQGVPQPREFSRFLQQSRLISRGSLDPWGNEYFLILTRDTIVVLSAGPDGERGTEDDLRHEVGRR